MKVFLTAIAVASAFANQADAQVTRPMPAQSIQPLVPTRAQGIAEQTRRARSTNPAHDVYDIQGRYVGSDPDPTIRSMLQSDPTGTD